MSDGLGASRTGNVPEGIETIDLQEFYGGGFLFLEAPLLKKGLDVETLRLLS